MAKPTRVLFVCLGNICRSPTAEGVFRSLVEARGLEDTFEIDSAGTGAWHAGEAPDARMTRAAKKHGFHLRGQARAVRPDDFTRFDVILAMDSENLRNLRMKAPSEGARVELFRDYDTEEKGEDVPDPYYGGAKGFDEVVIMVERTATHLLDRLLEEREK